MSWGGRIYSDTGDMFQDPQRMPETAGSTGPKYSVCSPIQTHIFIYKSGTVRD
jgi:hypothetical protein